VDDERRSDLAAHTIAVGDREQARAGISGVLVDLAASSGV
jgi:hypothetical protein